MIEDGIVADEYTYRNMISLAIKTSDFKRLYASIDTLFRRSIPVTKALLRDIVSMLARPKKFYVSSGLACAIRNRYPMGVPEEIEQWKSRQEKYDAIQQQYVALAIKVLEKQVEQAGVLRWYQLNLVLGACFVSADPELHFHAIESLLKKVSDRTSVVEFKKMVLESNYWPIIFKYLNPLNEFDFGLIKEYITTLGQIKDADTLYTIAYHVKNPKVLLVVMEQIGLHVRNEAMTRLVWDIVPEWTEELLWAKLRCLIWWGYHTEAIEEATVKYRDGTGFVVIELQKYLRSQGYDEKEQIVINYWTPRNPDWILEDAVF
jgi:hypothetical protein